MSDVQSLTFEPFVRMVPYGDQRRFAEYRILMFQRGRLVGIEDGPHRRFIRYAEALQAARARIRTLGWRRLFVVRITEADIRNGEARDCSNCAIAQALWHNQERMGLPRRDWAFWVSPYGFFAASERLGIRLQKRFFGDECLHLPSDALPDMVHPGAAPGAMFDSMIEFAMSFDDWEESRHMSLKEWREKNGSAPDERPYRPGPRSFVLNLDAFQVARA